VHDTPLSLSLSLSLFLSDWPVQRLVAGRKRREERTVEGKDARMLRKHSEKRERITTKRWHYVESTRNERET